MDTVTFKEQIKKLPAKPGIYLFSAKGGSASGGKNKPLYIGKALNLKSRVKNYSKTSDPRLVKMLTESNKIDFIQTDTDIEALILESQYIKKYQPAFNIMLRDDKQYGFVGFTDDKYPKIFITHQPTNSKDFIGPFTEIGALKTTLRLLRKIFPYCTCKQLHNNYCLNYHIGKCPGFCCLKQKPNLEFKILNSKFYKKNIKAIRDILSGKKTSLIKNLEKEMKNLSGKQEFERAKELQYKIEKLKRIFQNATIIENLKLKIENSDTNKKSLSTLKNLRQLLNLSKPLHRIEAYDIANIQGKHAVGAMAVFTNGTPDKNEYRKFKIRVHGPWIMVHGSTGTGGDVGMLKQILLRRFNHPEWKFPDLILIDGGKAQLNAAKEAMRIMNHELRTPIIAVTKDEHHMGKKIYIFGKEYSIPLSNLPRDVKNLLLEIDSEAHRFVISYYRKLHRTSLNRTSR